MAGKNKSKAIAKRKQEIALMPISMEDVQNKIIVLRDEPVILDRDVAELYGVQTKEINQAVRNNPEKFPAGYMFMLNNQEVAEVRSKILTTSSESIEDERVMPDFLKSHYNPVAFTERGLYMMATILKSKQAAKTISLTDMAHSQMQEHIIFKWMSQKNTIEYLEEWEALYNPNFNYTEFGTIRNMAGNNMIYNKQQ